MRQQLHHQQASWNGNQKFRITCPCVLFTPSSSTFNLTSHQKSHCYRSISKHAASINLAQEMGTREMYNHLIMPLHDCTYQWKETKMNMSRGAAVAILAVGLILVNFIGQCNGALQEGFYKGKCGLIDVEVIVAGVVSARFFRDPSIVAALLRLQFHDCFVNGCDASILLDGSSSEKTAFPNLSVRGYDVIDAAKAAVETLCPNLVSCADIIAMATRDAVFLSKGGRYKVQTGRKDGFVSLAQNVDLPSPFFSVSQSIAAFARKGLSPTDMVILLGGHTVGNTHCSLFSNRLYNFQNTGKPDPNMDSSLADALRRRCPQLATVDNTINLDQNPPSAFIVDNSYYTQILSHRGVLQIDQDLALDSQTNGTVTTLANGFDFSTKFGLAMVKLGAVEVLNGNQGEIRKSCRAIN